MRWTIIAIVIWWLALAPEPLLAQTLPFGQTAQLRLTPAHPGPHEEVTLQLDDYGLAQEVASISWFVNDTALPDATNEREVVLTTGAITETQEVSAVLTLRGGQQNVVSTTIEPSTLVLLFEPETTTPSWYRGRALPSPESRVRVVAIPQTSTGLSPEAYTYTWRMNNQVLDGGPVAGRHTRTVRLPFSRDAQISVTVQDRTGRTVAQRSVILPVAEPQVHFYPLNPLRGQSPLAVTDQTPLVANELTLRAEPYYMETAESETASILHEWEVNGRTIENPSTDPQTITVQNGGGSGTFRVTYHIRNRTNLLQGVRETFTLTF